MQVWEVCYVTRAAQRAAHGQQQLLRIFDSLCRLLLLLALWLLLLLLLLRVTKVAQVCCAACRACRTLVI
jgi:hypothetical protein